MKNPKFRQKRATLGAVMLAITSLAHQPLSAQTTHTWTNAAGGAQNWSTGTNWSGGTAPNPIAGDTVDFSTINLAANAALTLDADRTAGIWKFGDTASTQTWTVNSGFTMTLAGTTPTIHVSTNSATLNNTVAGTSGFTKSGGGTLSLAGSNTITGDLAISGGTLAFSNLNAWGGTGKNVAFTGSATLTSPDSYSGGEISIGSGFTATISSANLTFASTAGPGKLVSNAGSNKLLNIGDASGLTGTLQGKLAGNANFNTSVAIQFSGLNDAAGSALQFIGGTSDSNQGYTIAYNGTSAMTFNNRQVQILQRATGNWEIRDNILANNSVDPNHTWVINTDLLYSGGQPTTSPVTPQSGRKFILSGTNTGDSIFAGTITDGVVAGVPFSVQKSGAGKWTLGGNNTFTGPVTVSVGTLGVSSISNASVPNPLGLSSAAAANLILSNGATLQYSGGAASTDRGFTINGTAAGHQATLDASGSGPVSFTNPATPAYGTTAQTRTLNLSGTSSANNTLAALIADNGGAAVSVNKSGSGTWLLSGTNTYSGDTTITGGVLSATEGVGLSTNSALTLNGGAFEPGANFARLAGNSAGKITLIGGASGFSARGGDIQVAIGTLGSPAALVMGASTFVPGTLVLNAATADSKLTFLNPVNISGFNFQVSVGAATAEMSGVISGDLSGSLTKIGNGTLILSASNTSQGNVTVNAGTLSLTQPNLSQYSSVTVINGAALHLNFTGTTSVASLTLGGVPKAPGAYNSTNAAPFITGTGVIFVNGGDADEDGMPDGWELLYGFNPNDAADATADLDGDGLSNVDEYVAATSPNTTDTDTDGLTDGQELNGIINGEEVIVLGTSPLNPDSDGDGVKDGEEYNAGSNPLLVDTDADGAPDWYEVKASFTNPALASSKPIVPYPLPRPSAAAGASNKPVKVFIMSGQSNMVGMGNVTPLGTPGTLSTVVKQQGRFPNFVNADGSWTVNNDVWYRSVVTEPDNAALTVGQGAGDAIGPELGFGRVLGYALDEQVLLIKSAEGNRSLGWDFLPPGSPSYTYGANTYAGYGNATQSWLTGSTPVPGSWYAGKQFDQCFLNEADWSPTAATIGFPPETNVVDVLDDFANQYPQWAAQGFEIAGYVWFQGNKDIGTGPPYSTRYETHMVNFIKELRSYYANRYPGKCTINTPFVLATGCGDPGTSGNGLVVATAQLAAGNSALHPEFAGNVKTMDTRPYWRDVAESPVEQGFHYNRNAETFALTGDALGRGMLELLGGFTDTTAPVLGALTPATTTTNVATAANFVASFDEVIVAGTGNILLKNLTDNITTNIAVTDSSQVTTFGSVLTINPTAYLKPNKQYAIQIPAGVIKDYAGNSFAGINDDVTWTFTSGQGDSLTAALIALTDHVNGVSTLTAEQIATHKATIDGLKDRIGEDENIIASAFELIEAYDTVYGALWVGSGQMTRSAETGNLQWTIYRVMQSIMDYAYTRGNIVAFPTLFDGFKFGSSSNFPGACAAPPTNSSHTVEVNASFNDSFGRETQGWTWPARRPTGTYLAPGTIATVTVPPALVNAGFKIRVGAHSWDFSNKPYIKRLDRSSLQYDIIGTDVKIASPLGGGIYIETPFNANAGVVNVTITGAVRSPFFQNTSFNQTSLAEWVATERTNPAPWADFQTDKFMMQVPRSWIYAFADPLSVLNDWDSSMDAINDLMGFPHIRGKDTMYLQVDVFNRSAVFSPGYPTVNVSYNPTTDYGGNFNHYLLRGPQYTPDYVFHEQGHSYFFTKFGGENESTVNLLYVPVLNQKFGVGLEEAFKRSFGTYNGNIPSAGFKDNVAVLWMTSFNFSPFEQPMASWEKSYQHQGHAKFVDIAQLYGWGALNDFWYYYNDKDSNNITVPKDDDSLMVKLCETSAADVRPLLHFWGVPPSNAANVASQVSGLGLTPPVEIYDLLMNYKSKLPTNNASYQAFCTLYYGHQPSIGGAGVEREHARQWSTTLLNGTNAQVRFPTEIYDEAAYAAVAARVQEIIDLYYPTGRPPSNNARLADLQPGLGTLSPGFNGTTYNYSTVVPFSATSMTITPVASDPSASITVNGVPVTSGNASGPINVSAASTVINIVVVSSDTTVTSNYSVTVTHAAASANADLANLIPNAGTLTPTFASGTTSYSATVPNAVSSLTLTPTVAQSGATITVNGSPVSSGTPSGAIALNVGNNVITTVVLAEDSSTTKTYTLTVQRTANADLNNLATSSGTLAPVFNTTTYNYTATVSFGTTSMTVTPTAADPSASITVNGNAVVSGNSSAPIALVVGNNVITTVVVSQDLSTTNTYTLNVTRVAPGSRWWDGGTADLVGNGNGASAGGAGTWTLTTVNWDQGNNLPYVNWENGNDDTAVFAGTAGTVTLASTASASGLRFDTANYIVSGGTLTLTSPATITANANATVSSIIAGSNGITKAGGATATLSGANTFSGGVTINAGTLSFGNVGAWGGAGRNVTFGGNGTLTTVDGYTGGQITVNSGQTGTITAANLTFASTTGSGALVYNTGVNKLLNIGIASAFNGNLQGRLSGNANIGTNIALQFSGLSDAVGSALQFIGGTTDSQQGYTIAYNGGSALTFNNRQVQILQRAGSNWEIRDNILANNSANAAHKWVINTNLSYTGGQANTGPQTGRNFILSGSNTGDNEFAGTISDGVVAGVPFNVQKSGLGKWILSGNSTFTGSIIVQSGTLGINSIADFGTNSAIGRAASGSLRLGNTSFTATLDYIGAGNTSNRNFQIGDSSAANTGGGVISNNGTGALTFSTTNFNTAITGITAIRTLTLGGANTGNNHIQGIIQDNVPSTGKINLAKTGTGTWNLSGANSFTGTTTISDGTLLINGNSASATGAVAVNGVSTLGGGGTIGGTVTVAASSKLDPGNSVGIMTINGGLNISAMAGGAGTIRYELASLTASDRINVGGTVTIGSAALGIENFVFANAGGLENGTYTLISGASISGTLRTGFLSGPVGSGTGTLQLNGSSIELVVSGIIAGDTTPPTLAAADIVDNQAGGPVIQYDPVSYVITFSEDIDATTVSAADFGNAGSAALTIDSVSETTPGVFAVQVTPTTAGTLRLRVNAGAVLADVAGNALDTASAISDDTIITVNMANVAPVWTSNPVNETNAAEDVIYAATLIDDANDANDDTLVFAKVSGPGWLFVAADGTLSGIPAQGDVGANSFTVSVSDGIAPAVQASLNIMVVNTNDAPVWASNPVNGADAGEDSVYAASLAGSAGDVDPGASLTFAKVSGPAWLSIAANGAISGTPVNSDVGANSFTVTVSDGIAAAVQATLNITVTNTNDAPVWTANPVNEADATEDSAYVATIANDASDVDAGATLTYAKMSGPAWLSVAGNGALSGTPENSNVGVNSFTVSVNDGIAPAVEATLNITVMNTNDAPVWANNPVNKADATEDSTYAATLANDASDVDTGATLTYAKVNGPAWLSVAADGAISGTPDNSNVGANSFTVSVTDGIAAAVQETLNITVTNTNDAPVFVANPMTGPDATEDAAYSGNIAASAGDVDAGASLTFAKVSGPAWLSVAANGTLSGTPANSDAGANSFTVSVSDGIAAVEGATLSISVINTNDTPVWTVNPVNETNATEGSAYTSTLANDSADVDTGAALTFAKVSGPAWLSVASNGDLSGTPTNSDVGSNSFTVSVSDGIAAAVQAILNITVTNTNDSPTWAGNPVTGANATEDAAYSGSLAGNASDADAGAALTFAKVSGPAWLAVASNGALSGTPVNSNVGANSFTVSVSDGIAAAVQTTLNITVTNTNDAPVFTTTPIVPAGATEGVAYTGQTIAGSATDADAGDTITYSKVSGPVWLTVASNGALSGTPTAGSAGLNSFAVRATDSNSAASDATLQITVTGLPLPWVSGDIGIGMLAGSTTFNAGIFTQAGSGVIGSTADKLRFTYQTLSGDGEIIARIGALQNTGTSARVGVMIRDTLATNSKQIFMGMTGSNSYRWVRRTSTGGSTSSTNSSSGTVPNTWVRLVRNGTTITAYKSTNGTSWTTVGSTTNTTFASTCYIGLAVGSGSDTTLNTSQFSNVSVTP